MRDNISEIRSSCSFCQNQKESLHWRSGQSLHTQLPDASVVCCFLSYDFLLFVQLRGQTLVLPEGWSGTQKGMEGLQGCWMQEVEPCSRGRSRVENWKHFTLGWWCVQCVWVGLLKLVKRESREQNFAYDINSSFFLYRTWSEIKTVNLTRCFIIYVSHKQLFLVNAMEIYFKRNGGEEREIFKAQNRGKIGIYI